MGKKTFFILFIMCGLWFKSVAQRSQFVDSLFFEKPTPKTRIFVKPKYKYNPIGYLGTGALFIYQNVISEQIQATCAYHYSCSEFTKLCIRDYGFLKGTFIGLHQIMSCLPFVKYDTHPLYLNSNDLIINEHYLKK
ncbi:MAG: membrane protein insertion efficiency factor YidD [Bacteroidota bacterium]|jgi:putative component of membrane protein insertase Oxa1/YidC/SpoIIIJ protein YidD|nr:membrane protein insertion efficiency factor YidD [Bacteroidota bacterium]MCA6444998.1 membrane protein insertion efficiency factor YidD [Bacteroidota bacterium]